LQRQKQQQEPCYTHYYQYWYTICLNIRTRDATTSLKLGGPMPWSWLLLPFYRKKLDRSTQFGAVGYIITLYSSKSYVKRWGSGPPRPTSGCARYTDGIIGGNGKTQRTIFADTLSRPQHTAQTHCEQRANVSLFLTVFFVDCYNLCTNKNRNSTTEPDGHDMQRSEEMELSFEGVQQLSVNREEWL